TVHVGERILKRVTHTCLGCQIDDHFRSEALNAASEVPVVGQIYVMKNESCCLLKLRQARFFQIHIIVVIQIVYARDAAATIQQSLRQVKPNEASRSRDQDFHNSAPAMVELGFVMFIACSTGRTPFPGRCTEVISNARNTKDSTAVSEMC